MRKDRFGIFVKSHNRTIIQSFLERMVYNSAGLMMLDLDRRLWPGPVPRPLYMPGDDVLRPLKPLEAYYGSRAALRLSQLDTTLCELVHLFSGNGVLGKFYPVLHRDPNPRIRKAFVEFVRMQSVNDAPCLPAQHHDLFRRAQSLTFCAGCQQLVNFVSPTRRDGFN